MTTHRILLTVELCTDTDCMQLFYFSLTIFNAMAPRVSSMFPGPHGPYKGIVKPTLGGGGPEGDAMEHIPVPT